MSSYLEVFDPPAVADDRVARALAREALEEITGVTGATVDLAVLFVRPVAVYVNGLRLASADYTLDGPTLTLTTPLGASDVLLVAGKFRPPA